MRPHVEAELRAHDSIEHNLHVSNAVCISYFAYENSIVLFILDALLIYPVDIDLSSLIYFSDRFNSICMVWCLFQNKDKFDVIWEVFIFLFLNEIFIRLCRLLLSNLFFYIIIILDSLQGDTNAESKRVNMKVPWD